MSTSGTSFAAETTTTQLAGVKTLVSYNAPVVTFNNYANMSAAGGSQNASGS